MKDQSAETVRAQPYTREYRDACLEIFWSNVPSHFSAGELLDFSRDLEQENLHYYLLFDGEALVGCGGFEFGPLDHEATLRAGLIRKGCHGMGYGSLLLDYRIREILRMSSCRRIKLNTMQHSFRFFERKGFSLTEVVVDGWAKGYHIYRMELLVPEEEGKISTKSASVTVEEYPDR